MTTSVRAWDSWETGERNENAIAEAAQLQSRLDQHLRADRLLGMNVRLLILPAIAAVAAAALWWSADEGADPACTWRIGTCTDIRQGSNYDELAPDTPFRLSFRARASTHVYVFSHNAEDGTVLLWPSPELHSDRQQPLPAGQSVLPGSIGDKELAWTTRSGIRATTTYAVVASLQPVAELEALLPTLRHWTNTVFPDHTMLVTNPPSGAQRADRTSFPNALLELAARHTVTERLPNGPLTADPDRPGLWYGSWRIVEKKP